MRARTYQRQRTTRTVVVLQPDTLSRVSSTWDDHDTGLMRLPSGRVLRGRGLARQLPPAHTPSFGLYLLGRRPVPVKWEARWVQWPDFRLPKDRDDAQSALRQAWLRAEHERVEIACQGGLGRTGTALACIAILDGVAPEKAVKFVRENYNSRAVETPWQRQYVARFTAE